MCDKIRSAYAQHGLYCTCKNVHILQLAEHARKFIPRMLSMRWNRFRVGSACDKIVSAYAQHTHAIIFEVTQKSLIKMQMQMKNHLGTYLIGPKWRFWEKKFLDISQKKFWFRVCSVTAEMFEHRNSGENRRKRSKIFFENLRRAYKDLIKVKKNSKLSHACVPLRRYVDYWAFHPGSL